MLTAFTAPEGHLSGFGRPGATAMRMAWSSLSDALLRPLLRRLVRVTTMPEDAGLVAIDPARPVCYALHLAQWSSLMVLADTSARLRLPDPLSPLRLGGHVERNAFFFLTRSGQPSPLRRQPYRYAPRLARLVDVVAGAVRDEEPSIDCQIVPVSVFWGQAPRQDDSLLRLLLADTWIVPGFFRQMLRVIVHGRHASVRFGPPLSLRDIVAEVAAGGAADGAAGGAAGGVIAGTGLAARSLRRVGRLLRARYQTDRAQVIGPSLSHRQTVIESIVGSAPVRAAIAADAASRGIPSHKAELRARRFAVEIAADFSYPTIRALNLLFTGVFERLYDSIEATRFEAIGPAAGQSTIVYVPNHRSHVDYMVLHFVLLRRRMQVPHVAAGANLNLPLVGTVLRRGGAFFLRRSFKGEALYAAVFERYLDTIIARGFPIEYFIEGGRSRTGRMLAPRSGLLTMTVESHLRAPARDIVFVPVHFAYERLVEGESYRAELAGRAKRKETLGAFLRSLRVLGEHFGQVRVNVGEPLSLAAFLREAGPLAPADSAGLRDRIDHLGRLLTQRINAAVVIGPINLVAVALAGLPGGTLGETHLAQLIDDLRTLLQRQPYSAVQALTPFDGRQTIAAALERGILVRIADPAGDVMRLTEQPAVLLGYFRNNVVHAWALFALIAAVAGGQADIDRATLREQVRMLYRFAATELFLSLPDAGAALDANEPGVPAERVDAAIDILVDLGYLRWRDDLPRHDGLLQRPAPGSAGSLGLAMLIRLVEQPLQRYLLVVTVLVGAGSGVLGRADLEARCAALAQRIGLLGNLQQPEVLDPRRTSELIERLVESGWLDERDGRLRFDDALQVAALQARRLLDETALLAIGDTLPARRPPQR